MKTLTDLQNLLALADKAMLDFETSHPHPRPVRDTTRCVDCTCVEGGASAEAFISACSPETIREIVSRLMAAEAETERSVIIGLEQARRIVKYFSQNPLLIPAAKSVLADVDIFLQASIERGGKDGTAHLMVLK